MRKVYIVFKGDSYKDCKLIMFSTKEEAEKYVKPRGFSYDRYYLIEPKKPHRAKRGGDVE